MNENLINKTDYRFYHYSIVCGFSKCSFFCGFYLSNYLSIRINTNNTDV